MMFQITTIIIKIIIKGMVMIYNCIINGNNEIVIPDIINKVVNIIVMHQVFQISTVFKNH